MTPDEIRSLFDYDAWANSRTLGACAALAPEQFTRNLGSSFGSVRDTLVHTLGAQMIWLERLNGGTPAGMPKPDAYPDFAAVTSAWDEFSPKLLAYIGGLSAADIDRVFEYRNLKGDLFRDHIGQVLQHLANHGTYHRGQVTTLLRQLGAKPASADLIGFYRERAKKAAQ